jgi:hypothetical protein
MSTQSTHKIAELLRLTATDGRSVNERTAWQRRFTQTKKTNKQHGAALID